jgi:hypothetical protein
VRPRRAAHHEADEEWKTVLRWEKGHTAMQMPQSVPTVRQYP